MMDIQEMMLLEVGFYQDNLEQNIFDGW